MLTVLRKSNHCAKWVPAHKRDKCIGQRARYEFSSFLTMTSGKLVKRRGRRLKSIHDIHISGLSIASISYEAKKKNTRPRHHFPKRFPSYHYYFSISSNNRSHSHSSGLSASRSGMILFPPYPDLYLSGPSSSWSFSKTFRYSCVIDSLPPLLLLLLLMRPTFPICISFSFSFTRAIPGPSVPKSVACRHRRP